jgi:hypothetical protein
MESSLYNSYQQEGGGGDIFTSWLFIAIIFWVIAIYLWSHYYFGFTDKNDKKFGYVIDNEHAIRGTQTGIFFFITGLAVLLAFTGKWQNQVNEKSDFRKYFVIPLCWLTLGFQISLIVSISQFT